MHFVDEYVGLSINSETQAKYLYRYVLYRLNNFYSENIIQNHLRVYTYILKIQQHNIKWVISEHYCIILFLYIVI